MLQARVDRRLVSVASDQILRICTLLARCRACEGVKRSLAPLESGLGRRFHGRHSGPGSSSSSTSAVASVARSIRQCLWGSKTSRLTGLIAGAARPITQTKMLGLRSQEKARYRLSSPCRPSSMVTARVARDMHRLATSTAMRSIHGLVRSPERGYREDAYHSTYRAG